MYSQPTHVSAQDIQIQGGGRESITKLHLNFFLKTYFYPLLLFKIKVSKLKQHQIGGKFMITLNKLKLPCILFIYILKIKPIFSCAYDHKHIKRKNTNTIQSD